MSRRNEPVIDAPRGSGTSDRSELLNPTIKDESGRSVTPVYTGELSAYTENDNRRHRTLCGETYVEAIGEGEWNITVSGMVVLSQLRELVEMRPANNPLTVVTEVDVYRRAEFGRFEWRQSDEMNSFRGDLDGREIDEPLFEFTLQTQDDNA